MKKIILILLVLIPLVNAAQTLITPIDFSSEQTHAIRLEDGDGISFYVNNKKFIISIDEIGKNSIRVKSFLYDENGSKETFYIPLNGQLSYKLDFDKDEIYDLKVDLMRIEENSNKAVVLFERIDEPKGKNNEVTGGTVFKNSIFNVKGIILTILIIIIGLVAYFTFKK